MSPRAQPGMVLTGAAEEWCRSAPVRIFQATNRHPMASQSLARTRIQRPRKRTTGPHHKGLRRGPEAPGPTWLEFASRSKVWRRNTR